MKKTGLILAVILLAGCGMQKESTQVREIAASSAAASMNGEVDEVTDAIAVNDGGMRQDDAITVGSRVDRGMIVDNVYHDEKQGDIHFSSYFPQEYDGTEDYALFVTNPGWEGEYPQGVGNNLGENFPFEARKYNDHMIILSTQLYDWGEKSAEDSLALIHHFIDHYSIDTDRIYLHGYSGGGETGSIMMGIEPELFAAVFLNSTKWDSDYETIASARTPLRLSVGEDDSYYGSQPLKDAYAGIHAAYEAQGLDNSEIDDLLVLDVKDRQWFTDRGYSDEHDGGNAFAKDEETMSWLFSHARRH